MPTLKRKSNKQRGSAVPSSQVGLGKIFQGAFSQMYMKTTYLKTRVRLL